MSEKEFFFLTCLPYVRRTPTHGDLVVFDNRFWWHLEGKRIQIIKTEEKVQ